MKVLDSKGRELGGFNKDYTGKYRFIPAVSSRKPSRKAWDTPEQAIPGWAKKLGATIIQ